MMQFLKLVILCFFALPCCSIAQENTAFKVPNFKFLRAQEDYHFLKDDSLKDNFWKRIKYLSIGENSYLTLGGDIRTEGQILRNEDWRKGNNDAALFQRFMLHSDFHVGKRIRFFTQLKNGFTVGRNGPAFPLNDDLDIHQFFLGIKFNNSVLEIGRRELLYGSRRLISVREGTNIRQSFDGLRWVFEKENNRLDILAYAYNPQRVGAFNNAINTDQLLWGAYWVMKNQEHPYLNIDLYYLGVQNEETAFEEGELAETRHSLGLRHWGNKNRFRFNNEFIFQFGKYGEGEIRAWTISTETYYQLTGEFKPTFGLKAEIISGDNTAEDGDLQTFNPLYPRGGYFGLLALIGPANLMDIHPSFEISIGEKLKVNTDWDFFWRHRLTDGIYFPSGRLNIAGNNSQVRFIGHQPGIQLAYEINPHLELGCSFFYFISGQFLKETTEGNNFTQIGSSVSFKF